MLGNNELMRGAIALAGLVFFCILAVAGVFQA
jgi:hypothetical protein